MNYKDIEKKINKFDFVNAYNDLCTENFGFKFSNLTQYFPKVKATTMYLFLTYAISINESVELHLSICNYLYFMDPYILGADRLIKTHLNRILEIDYYNTDALKNWIFGVYYGNPDNPFTLEELIEYKKRIDVCWE